MEPTRRDVLIAVLVVIATSTTVIAGKRRAEPVITDHAKVDQIVVTSGDLADEGAGVARWAARTIEMCAEDSKGVKRGFASVVVELPPEDSRETQLSVRGPADLRGCLETRRTQLVWTAGRAVTVKMRVTVTR